MPLPAFVAKVQTLWQTAKAVVGFKRQVDELPRRHTEFSLQNDRERLHDEVRRLKEENARLRRQQRRRGSMRLEDGAQWFLPKGKSPREGPYCPTCWADEEKLLPLHPRGRRHVCHKCGFAWRPPSAEPDRPRAPARPRYAIRNWRPW